LLDEFVVEVRELGRLVRDCTKDDLALVMAECHTERPCVEHVLHLVRDHRFVAREQPLYEGRDMTRTYADAGHVNVA
jgi:hypothetical protein